MFRQLAMIAVVGSLAGCQGMFNGSERRVADRGERDRLAALAAAAEFPREAEERDDLHAAAIVNRDQREIRIYNFTNEAIRNAEVWVNGSFVHRADVIPANGSITVSEGDFFDRTGRNLRDTATTPRSLHIQRDEELYRLQGPAFD